VDSLTSVFKVVLRSLFSFLAQRVVAEVVSAALKAF
jgi:hypothetical protein